MRSAAPRPERARPVATQPGQSTDTPTRARRSARSCTSAWRRVHAFGNGPPSAQAGSSVPDVVGNLRVDQAWGYLSLSAAAHQSKALYYGSAGNTAPGGGDPGLVPNGHPQDKWGWAAQVASRVASLAV